MFSLTDLDEFKHLREEVENLIQDNEVLPIVDQALYLRNDGTWDVRFGMSGYTLGLPSIEELLKAYAFASAGVEVTDGQVERNGPIILGKLIGSLKSAIRNYKANVLQANDNQRQLVTNLIMIHLNSGLKDESTLSQICKIGGDHASGCKDRITFVCTCGIKEAAEYYDLVIRYKTRSTLTFMDTLS